MSTDTTRAAGRREKRALDLYVKLTRASVSLGAALNGPLLGEDLTESQMGVLDALAHLGTLTQRELASKVLRSPANMTTLIDQLEKRDLLARERGEDRRCNRISLTPAGRKLFDRVFPQHASRLADAVSALSAAEQEELARLCRKLGTSIEGETSRTRTSA